jgi:hypothetical protein
MGRLVSGKLWEGRTVDDNGQPITNKKTGAPQTEYYFGFAIPKNDPINQTIHGVMIQEAQSAGAHPGMQSCVDAMYQGIYPAHPQFPKKVFSWKFHDGDFYPESEGFAGCWIYRFNSVYAPKIKNWNGTLDIVDQSQAKIGDHAIVIFTVKHNDQKGDRVGLYLSSLAVCIQKTDTALGGINAAGLLSHVQQPEGPAANFGGGAAPAVHTPGATMPAQPPGAPNHMAGKPGPHTPAAPGDHMAPPVQQTPGGMAPQPGGAPPQQTLANVPPTQTYDPGAVASGPPNSAPPPASYAPPQGNPSPPPPQPNPAITYTMTESAGGATREALIASGWTDDSLIAAGHMIAQNHGAMNA